MEDESSKGQGSLAEAAALVGRWQKVDTSIKGLCLESEFRNWYISLLAPKEPPSGRPVSLSEREAL